MKNNAAAGGTPFFDANGKPDTIWWLAGDTKWTVKDYEGAIIGSFDTVEEARMCCKKNDLHDSTLSNGGAR